jgi:myo-inositol 2-dehydrogenase/D-chiro-inositol 1-dehydrogenase
MNLRYGLIGSGEMGQEHIRNVALVEGASIVAIADPNDGMRSDAARLADGVDVYADHKQMLSADVCDAYIIATPNDTHHDVMLDVLAAGKPILCEKPLCTTTAECRDLIAHAQRMSAPVWVAMEYRFMAPVERLLKEVAAGTAGEARMIAIREHRHPFLHKVGNWNRFRQRTGGTLVEKCCHFWDLMRLALRSDPIRVYASAGMGANHLDERYDGQAPDITDNAFVIVDFRDGTRGMLDLCMFAEGSAWQEVISVTGTRARIDACVPSPQRFSGGGEVRPAQIVISDRATRTESIETVEVDAEILQAGDHYGSTFFQHQRFAGLVRSGQGSPEVTLEDGLWAVRVGEAAETSAATGRAIDLD